jgi:hypothetical protein
MDCAIHNYAKRVFTCSLSDFFHVKADPWRDEAWPIIKKSSRLVWLILTKPSVISGASISGAALLWCRSWLVREFGRGRRRVSPPTLFIVQSPEGMLDQSGQLKGSAVDGLVQGRCLVGDRDGLAPFEAGFHHATLAVVAALIAVVVAQVDLHSRDVIAQSA